MLLKSDTSKFPLHVTEILVVSQELHGGEPFKTC